MIKRFKAGFDLKNQKDSLLSRRFCSILISVFIVFNLLYQYEAHSSMMSLSDVQIKSSTAGKNAVRRILMKVYGTLNYSKALLHLETVKAGEVKDKFPYKEMLYEIEKDNKRVDFGKDFLNEIINYNNRLDYYDLYIKLAKQRGYIVTSYIDYLQNYKNTNKKVLILRHDIDSKNDATKYMFEIEKKNNVKATYYFRWETFDKELIQEIARGGFEVGLHYETIATYCIDHKLSRVTEEDIAKCREILKKEIKEFKDKSGVNIETISSHGNPVNKEIHVPNNVLLQGQNYKDFGIVSETYDRDILTNYIKSYICDADILKNYGYSYKANPTDSIIKDDKVIEFLSHPNHWNYNIESRARMYIEVLNDDYIH